MRRAMYFLLAATAVVIASAIFFRASTHPPGEPPFQQKEREAENDVSSNPVLNGGAAVTMAPSAQARVGIRVAPLAPASARRRASAPAVVLSAQSLALARSAYVSAQATLEKAQVNLGVSQAEFERVGRLYRDDQNVSQKTFQAAQAAVRSADIEVRAGHLELSSQIDLVRQQWGSVVAGWVRAESPELDRVVQQDAYLVELTLPRDGFFSPPASALLTISSSEAIRARLVSPLPQVDPRVQGTSLLYLAPARVGLAPGLALLAQLAVGPRLRGVVVPASAVVWSEGQAWVYVQTAADTFVRRPFSSDFSLEGNFFATRGFVAGDKIVVAGAQILLSAELSPRGAAAAPADEDDD